MRQLKPLTTLIAMLTVPAFFGCGDGDNPVREDIMPPPTPSASVEVSGNGDLVIHPSIDPTFCCTTEFPIRLRETAGGTAVWNFFRVSYLLNGAEIERSEQGSTPIREAGFRNIGANSTNEAVVFIRTNATEFDDVEIMLGFSDTKDGRQFEQRLTLGAFSGVLIDVIPAVLPSEGRTFAIVESSGE